MQARQVRLAPAQRWSVGRKRDVVLRLLRGESLAALSRVEIYRLEDLAGLERGCRQGDLVAEALERGTSGSCRLLRERARAAEQRRPLAMRRSRR